MKRKPKPAPCHEPRDAVVPEIQREAIKSGDMLLRAPIAHRAEWDDPDFINDRSKGARKVVGYRRADPLLTLHRRGELITKRHMDAANRYRDDYEEAEGARPGYERSEVRGRGTGGPGDEQLAALARWRLATQSVGIRQSVVLVDVVLVGVPVSDWASDKGLSRHLAMGFLVAALDRLEEHYDATGSAKKNLLTSTLHDFMGFF